MEEAATPLPSEETTPPVTNIYFGAIRIARVATRFTTPDCSYLSGEALQKPHHRIDVQTIMGELRHSVNSKSSRGRIENFYRRNFSTSTGLKSFEQRRFELAWKYS